MTTFRLDCLTRETVGTSRYGGLDADTKALLVAPARFIGFIATVLLLSGCELTPAKEQSAADMTLDHGDATVWLAPVPTGNSCGAG